MAGLSRTVLLSLWVINAVRTPECTHSGLGSSNFARRYFRNRCFFLFLRLLRCFSSPGSLCMAMDSPYSDWGLLSRVSPFRDPWIEGYLHLPMAYRSLSRLSSALSAKASTLRSLQLDQMLFSKLRHIALCHLAGFCFFILYRCYSISSDVLLYLVFANFWYFKIFDSIFGFQGTIESQAIH